MGVPCSVCVWGGGGGSLDDEDVDIGAIIEALVKLQRPIVGVMQTYLFVRVGL